MNNNEENVPITIGNNPFKNPTFTLGSLMLFGFSFLLTVTFSIVNYYHESNDSLNNTCNVKLFNVENKDKREITMLYSDAKILCNEWNRDKQNNLGSINIEEKFLLIINDEEFKINPFENQIEYDNVQVLLTNNINIVLDKYIDFIGVYNSNEESNNVSQYLTYDERLLIQDYFLNNEYKVKEMKISGKYLYYLVINGEYYYFDDFNGLLYNDSVVIEVNDEIIKLLKKSLERNV